MRRVVLPLNQVRSEFESADNVTVITDIVITDIIDGIDTTDGMKIRRTGRSSRRQKPAEEQQGEIIPLSNYEVGADISLHRRRRSRLWFFGFDRINFLFVEQFIKTGDVSFDIIIKFAQQSIQLCR